MEDINKTINNWAKKRFERVSKNRKEAYYLSSLLV